jgi:Domain of unknown function (DUF5916)
MTRMSPRRPGVVLLPVFWAAGLLGLTGVEGGAAQQSDPDTLRAYEIDVPVHVDGVLDEAAWSRAVHVTNFTQRELHLGAPATERTEVAVLYDDRSVYIGFWGYDRKPEAMVARKMERDFRFDSEDNFEVILDTYHDRRNGYLFVTNPNGAKADAAVIDNGGRVNRDWDGVWYVATQVTDEGWFAELEIPLSTLKFRSLSEQQWGINFERNIRRNHEQLLWRGWSRDSDLEQVARAGTLTGLTGLTSVRLMEAKPYSLGGLENKPALPWQSVSHLGGDLNYLVSPNIKLTLTVNPDFAQVESDRAQVNLTRFSLFFPEKREFFLEGKEFFDFILNSRDQPFFSRRVGLDSHGATQTILGGGRLLAKIGGATLGAMSLQTAARDDSPATNFTVLRWKQDVLEESTVGAVSVTKIQPGRVNTTNGVDLRFSTSHLFGNKSFSAGAALAQSYTSDAVVTTGMGHRLFIHYPSDLVEFDAAWNRAGTNFNPEVGFLRRTAYQEFYAELQFNPRPGFIPWMRQMEIKPLDLNYYIDDETGKMQSVFMEFRPLGFGTKSGEWMEFNIQRRAENLNRPFEISDEITIPQDEYWYTRYELQTSTFSGRKMSSEASMTWGDFYDGTRTEIGGSVTWRANKHLSLSTDYQWNQISLPGGSFTVTEVGGRADFAVSPELFGSVFGQWNDEDHEALFNFRINWIPKPGTDLFLVINQGVDTSLSRWRSAGTTLASKLVWRFVL